MNITNKSENFIEVTKIKLSALWIALMLTYLFADFQWGICWWRNGRWPSLPGIVLGNGSIICDTDNYGFYVFDS